MRLQGMFAERTHLYFDRLQVRSNGATCQGKERHGKLSQSHDEQRLFDDRWRRMNVVGRECDISIIIVEPRFLVSNECDEKPRKK